MNPSTALSTLNLVLPLAACIVLASASAQAQTGPCNRGVCKVNVAVPSCEGNPTVSVDPIPVPEPNNIEWNLVTNGYEFRNTSIVIQGTGFRNNPGATGSGKKFKVHDDWTDRRPDIKYSIQVFRKSDGKACAIWDPRISNN